MTSTTRKLAATSTAAFALLCTAGLAHGQDYQFPFQEPFGDRADFFVTGPATGPNPDPQGDAFLTSVLYPSGDEFVFYYSPFEVSSLQAGGDLTRMRVRAGTRTTGGLQGDYLIGESDWDDLTQQQIDDYERLILQAMQSNNLNTYFDISGNSTVFYFTISFEMPIIDNDASPDEFGELLYFERGAGSGNSWLKLRAVDEDGSPLGPWLVIGPSETVQTTPQTTVYNTGQHMGTTSIDVSRLGVTEFQYLQISNDVVGEPAYTGGGDRAPDFKFMAVMTNKDQLAREVFFD